MTISSYCLGIFAMQPVTSCGECVLKTTITIVSLNLCMNPRGYVDASLHNKRHIKTSRKCSATASDEILTGREVEPVQTLLADGRRF
jgi:hypothetical protein